MVNHLYRIKDAIIVPMTLLFVLDALLSDGFFHNGLCLQMKTHEGQYIC